MTFEIYQPKKHFPLVRVGDIYLCATAITPNLLGGRSNPNYCVTLDVVPIPTVVTEVGGNYIVCKNKPSTLDNTIERHVVMDNEGYLQGGAILHQGKQGLDVFCDAKFLESCPELFVQDKPWYKSTRAAIVIGIEKEKQREQERAIARRLKENFSYRI